MTRAKQQCYPICGAQAGLVAPIIFNIQDSLLHIEALAMDVSPRLINIEPTLIRFQARPLPWSALEGCLHGQKRACAPWIRG